jgi:hypothetical protein
MARFRGRHPAVIPPSSPPTAAPQLLVNKLDLYTNAMDGLPEGTRQERLGGKLPTG